MNVRIINVLMILSLLVVQIQAKEITGKIIDAVSGQAILQAYVLVDGQLTQTDASGNYTINVASANTLTVVKTGSIPETIKISDKTTNLNVILPDLDSPPQAANTESSAFGAIQGELKNADGSKAQDVWVRAITLRTGGTSSFAKFISNEKQGKFLLNNVPAGNGVVLLAYEGDDKQYQRLTIKTDVNLINKGIRVQDIQFGSVFSALSGSIQQSAENRWTGLSWGVLRNSKQIELGNIKLTDNQFNFTGLPADTYFLELKTSGAKGQFSNKVFKNVALGSSLVLSQPDYPHLTKSEKQGDELVIEWSAIPEATIYMVVVMDKETGKLQWSALSTETSLSIPRFPAVSETAQYNLAFGHQYKVKIIAANIENMNINSFHPDLINSAIWQSASEDYEITY